MKVLALIRPQQLSLVQMMVMAVAMCCLFSIAMPRAQAAELTQQQKDAIVSLVRSFGADQVVIENVSKGLNSTVALQPVTPSAEGSMAASVTNTREGQGVKPLMPTTRPVLGCNLSRPLKVGSIGDDVRDLQAFLKETGDLTEASTTNFFGPATERALKVWQARMGVISEGDSETTGFGAFGPKTREVLTAYCKKIKGGDNASITGTTTATTIVAPTCVLKSTKSIVRKGDSMVLYWESKNATYASSMTGEKGPVRGQVKLTPTETTTYVKKVYGPGGEGSCTATVEVGDTIPATERKVVIDYQTIDLRPVFSLLGSGMAAVFEGYVNLFDFN